MRSSAKRPATLRTLRLTCPPGIDGTVVDVQVFTRKGQDKDERSLDIEEGGRRCFAATSRTKSESCRSSVTSVSTSCFEGRKLQRICSTKEVVIKKGTADHREMLKAIEPKALRKVEVASARRRYRRGDQGIRTADRTSDQDPSDIYDEKITKLKQGDELAAGRDQDGQGLRRDEAQAVRRRQDGRPSR